MRENKKRWGRNDGSLPPVLAIREVAQLLGVHINTVRNWGDRGLIPVYRVGPRRDRRFRREDVVAFFEGSGKAGPNGQRAQDIIQR